MSKNYKIGIVIPSFRVKDKILNVLEEIDEDINNIYVVDDKCPENSGKYVEENCRDPRVKVLYNPINLGVGGAVKTGYKRALEDQCDIIVKVDGDGQMSPKLIKGLISPILMAEADYVKGNRFYNIEDVKTMPGIRLFGNSVLSLINKMVNGYWNIVDPTNGFTAIHRQALGFLPLEKINNRYFFESDMLFRLATIRAVVRDFPMKAVYADEKSSLKIQKIIFEFPFRYFISFHKRIFYLYILRDFNAGTIQLFLGIIFTLFGFIFGAVNWYYSVKQGLPATSGTVMLASLPLILGVQFLISSLNFDLQNVPERPILKDFIYDESTIV